MLICFHLKQANWSCIEIVLMIITLVYFEFKPMPLGINGQFQPSHEKNLSSKNRSRNVLFWFWLHMHDYIINNLFWNQSKVKHVPSIISLILIYNLIFFLQCLREKCMRVNVWQWWKVVLFSNLFCEKERKWEQKFFCR